MAIRTLDQRPSIGSMIKPGELIDILENTSRPLTLLDRRNYNLLILNAWDRIGEEAPHQIHLAELRGTDTSNARVKDSIERLMTTIVRVRYLNPETGRPNTIRVQLLGGNRAEDESPDGFLAYRFDPLLIELLQNSRTYGRLRIEVMAAFESKYALAAYEMAMKRRNLRHVAREKFTIEEMRGLLGVQDGKLSRFSDLNAYALRTAELEVNALAEEVCIAFEPEYRGRRCVGIWFQWRDKTPEERKAAFAELQRPRVGRSARLRGSVVDTV